ncbi:MAG: carboxypeptidase-like regulatory domain-containing protein, partial [Candidatus Acidiferrum sp.]
MKRVCSLFCLGFFLLFCLTPGFAQTGTTSLRGTVVDKSGAAIPDAQVTLASAEIGVSLNTQTDKDGFYQFQDVRPATYVLTVSAPGFATLKKSGLMLLV